MPNSRSPYRSYLLRLWRDSTGEAWRASVQNIRSGETRHFAQPKELWAYLLAEMTNGDRPNHGDCTRPAKQGMKE